MVRPSEKKTTKKSSGSITQKYGGWLFLAFTVLIYGLIYLLKPDYGVASLHHFFNMLKDLAPILLLVFVFLWLLEMGKGMKDKLARLAGRDSGPKGWLIAIGGGILSHGPVYAWYPLLQGLQQQGTRPALLASFLYARSIKLPWLPLMAHYFGMGYMLILTLYIALFSIINGWLVEILLGHPASWLNQAKDKSRDD